MLRAGAGPRRALCWAVALAPSAFDAGLVAEPAASAEEALKEITRRQLPDAIPPRILIGGAIALAATFLVGSIFGTAAG